MNGIDPTKLIKVINLLSDKVHTLESALVFLFIIAGLLALTNIVLIIKTEW